jgi:hypothetical protein
VLKKLPKKEAVAANTEEAPAPKVKKSSKAKKKILKNNNNIKLIRHGSQEGVGSSRMVENQNQNV